MTPSPYIILIIGLVAAAIQAADAYTTWWILRRGGVELNPIMAAIMRVMGLAPALALTKGVPIALLLWAAWHVFQDPASIWWYAFPLLIPISAVPLPGNLAAMRRMKARGL